MPSFASWESFRVEVIAMKALKVGIAGYNEMKTRTLAIASGKLKPAPNSPKIWFTSVESFAKVLSQGNRDLLRAIAEQHPESLESLAGITGRSKSNLSRTLKTMARYGLLRLARGARGRLRAELTCDRVTLELPFAQQSDAR